MEDKLIRCKDCNCDFTWTVGEQKFYEEKGLKAPIRCKECRATRRAKFETKETQTSSDVEAMLKKFQENTIKINK